MSSLRIDEKTRQAALLSGRAAVANKYADSGLIEWASCRGLAVNVMRGSAWGNPFRIPRDGNRIEVVERFVEWVPTQPAIVAELPSLAGKLLVCCCHPKRCHADHLAELVNELVEVQQ